MSNILLLCQVRADGIENNFWYYSIDFNNGFKQYTEAEMIRYTGILKLCLVNGIP